MHARRAIPIPLMVVAVVVFLPLIIPVAIVISSIQDRRKRKAAAAFQCITCDKVLGSESIRVADEEFRKHMNELRRSHPLARFRVVRTCHAICTSCGARYTFCDQDRTFVPDASRESAVRA